MPWRKVYAIIFNIRLCIGSKVEEKTVKFWDENPENAGGYGEFHGNY